MVLNLATITWVSPRESAWPSGNNIKDNATPKINMTNYYKVEHAKPYIPSKINILKSCTVRAYCLWECLSTEHQVPVLGLDTLEIILWVLVAFASKVQIRSTLPF